VTQDVAQAWSLVETVYRAVPSPELAAALAALADRMGLPEKRVWLTRRLQRYHRGDTDADEPIEPPLAFVECDRDGDHLHQLRKHMVDHSGLAAPDITGEFEVRFRDESSVGSAVMREWMDTIAQRAFLPPAHRLLVSYDNGVSFLPDPAAPFLNPQWRCDFELLGRLLGLALWRQVTLDLPIHPYVCELLLQDGEPAPPPSEAEDEAQLAQVDAELHRHKVRWLLTNDVSCLGYDMPFTDILVDGGGQASRSGEVTAGASAGQAVPKEAAAQMESTPRLTALPEVVSPLDALMGEEQVAEPLRLRPFARTEVALVPNGEDLTVTEANKDSFVKALMEWRLRTALRGPIDAMLKGLRAAVPSAVIAEARRVLTASEIQALLAGSRDISSDDWERNTRTTGGLTTSSQEVRWFWQTVHQWAAEGRQDRMQDLLQFATGSRRVPVGGFAQLVGFNGGKHLFTLARGAHLSAESLPTSHACICTVDVPPWESFEAAQSKLTAAAENGRARFDEGTAARAGDDDADDIE